MPWYLCRGDESYKSGWFLGEIGHEYIFSSHLEGENNLIYPVFHLDLLIPFLGNN